MNIHSTPISELQSLLMSDRLLMLRSSYNELLFMYNPIRVESNSLFEDFPTYEESTKKYLEQIRKQIIVSSETNINLTDQYDSTELQDGSIAFHRIVGPIMSDSSWYFSTIQFERNFKAAEDNSQIAAHFFFCNSPGGDAFYLDQISNTLRNHTKPIYCFIRQMSCSAAYYLVCHSDVIKSNTQNDTIGSIGTMISFWDWDKYLETAGLRKVEYYATNSKLKNKKFDDLIEGKPNKFIQDVMDPINEQFMAEVQACRPIIGKMTLDNPVLQGETFRSEIAQTDICGLIDGITTFDQAVLEAHHLGQTWMKERNTQSGITKLFK